MKTILLVTAMKGREEKVSDLLRANAYKIIITDNAEEALSRAFKKEVDLVLCDFSLPCMNGGELLKELYDHTHIPFLTEEGWSMWMTYNPDGKEIDLIRVVNKILNYQQPKSQDVAA